MKLLNVLVAALGTLATVGVAHANLATDPVVFRSAKWEVRRSIDTMTDKVSCTGIYDSDYGVQLSDDTLFIRIQGGVSGVTLRFGDQPADKLRLPTQIEKKMSTVVIDGSQFNRLLGSNRLRLQAITVLDRVVEKDLDLTGLLAAHQKILDGCPGEVVHQEASKPSLCSDVLVQRMRAKALSPKDIAEICAVR